MDQWLLILCIERIQMGYCLRKFNLSVRIWAKYRTWIKKPHLFLGNLANRSPIKILLRKYCLREYSSSGICAHRVHCAWSHYCFVRNRTNTGAILLQLRFLVVPNRCLPLIVYLRLPADRSRTICGLNKTINNHQFTILLLPLINKVSVWSNFVVCFKATRWFRPFKVIGMAKWWACNYPIA